MRRHILFLLSVVAVEFGVGPFGGRVFDHFFPEERGFAGMIPDIPLYQWGYASFFSLGMVVASGVHRWKRYRETRTEDDSQKQAVQRAAPEGDENDLDIDKFARRIGPADHAMKKFFEIHVSPAMDLAVEQLDRISSNLNGANSKDIAVKSIEHFRMNLSILPSVDADFLWPLKSYDNIQSQIVLAEFLDSLFFSAQIVQTAAKLGVIRQDESFQEWKETSNEMFKALHTLLAEHEISALRARMTVVLREWRGLLR